MAKKDVREWLVFENRVNHHVKDVKGREFDWVAKMYMDVFNLLKKSGTIKSDISNATVVLSISKFQLMKLKGMRCVSHSRKVFSPFVCG